MSIEGGAHGRGADVERQLDERFDEVRAETIRTRSRWIWAVAVVVWGVSFAFVDKEAFPTWLDALIVRGPEIVVAAFMCFWLRRPRSLVAIDVATVLVGAIIAVVSAHGLSVVPIDKLTPKVASLMLSVLFVCLLGSFTWRATAGSSLAAVLALSGLPSRGAGTLYMMTLTVIGFAYAVLIVSAFSRDRMKRAEFGARMALDSANERLRREDEARRRLFVSLSHDFRTPLAVIRGEAELLSEGIAHAPGRRALHRIEANARALTDVTEQILELARVEAGQMPIHLRHGDVGRIVREVAAQLSTPKKRIEIEESSSPTVAMVDLNHLSRMVSNLVANALRQPGPAVEIAIGTEGDRVTIDVVDDGPGVPVERREAIFQRFVSFDADGSTTSGIGLPLARELAELNGGSLELLSNVERTTFRITLRAGNPEELAEAPEATSSPSSPSPFSEEIARDPDLAGDVLDAHAQASEKVGGTGGDRPRVLVVEDNADMATLLVRALEPRFVVERTATVEATLAYLREHVPAAVLSDILLPDGTGYDVLAFIRRTTSLSTLPVLFLSALGEVEERVRGIGVGADDYLTKPFSPKELEARLLATVRRSEARKRALEAERETLLMEIHDGVSGSLARASILLNARAGAASIEHAREAVRDGLDEVRAINALLSPRAEDWGGVVAAIRRAMTEACTANTLTLTFHADDDAERGFVSGAVAHAMKRIAREATTNIVKHANARNVRCELTSSATSWTMRIEDDGRGLPHPIEGGHGLGIIRRRVERLGGTLTIGNLPDRGAFVAVTITRT